MEKELKGCIITIAKISIANRKMSSILEANPVAGLQKLHQDTKSH